MKNQSSFNKYTKVISLLLCIPIVVVITLTTLLAKDSKVKTIVYHTSLWNEYAQEVDRSIKTENGDTQIGLEHVYGGIVSHHIPTTIPKLVDFYSSLKKTQNVKKFIIIGPDHTDAGKFPITISNASFFTTYGELKPIDGLALKLQELQLVNTEESPFDKEHSIGSQVLVISKIFPDAQITPIILRSNTTKGQAVALGEKLATVLDEDTVLIASVDFSHYLPTNQALPIDQVSGSVVRDLDIDSLSLVKADSSKTLAVLMSAMRNKQANDSSNFDVLNTNDLMQNSDYTTGYVFGYWGIGKKVMAEDVSSKATTLLFVGDIMLSRAIGKAMNTNSNWNFPFLKIAELLKSADITFANLEGPISNNGTKVGSIYSFRADPKTIEGLLYSGFDVVSIANNHIWDYGGEAFKDTLKILKENNISSVGGGSTYDEAHTPIIKEVNGIKIAYLGYTNLLPTFLGSKGDKLSVAFPEESQMVLDIQKAKASADIVVVSFHWGEEYKTHHNAFQEKLAHKAIDAGANLIIGHHPHVAQDMEKYKDGYIAYSLGNFVFDQNFSEDTRSGLLLKVTIKNKTIDQVISQKVNFNSSFQPYIVP